MEKSFHFTLDLEEDCFAALGRKEFKCLARIDSLSEWVIQNRIRITVFTTGEIIEKHPEVIKMLQDAGSFDIQLHAYDHNAIYQGLTERLANLERGLVAYKNFFGKEPTGYRAPNGMLQAEELKLLIANRIQYDSSIFPFYFPFRFNNFHLPATPFRFEEAEILEFPFSTINWIRFPLSVSYMQLFGQTLYGILGWFGWPKHTIFNFHLHDLFTDEWYREVKSRRYKLFYYRASKVDGMKILDSVLKKARQNGYLITGLDDLHRQFRQPNIMASLPKYSLNQLKSL